MMRIKSALALIVVCTFAFSCKKEKNRICDLYSKDVGYAVGTIQSFSSAPFKVTYKYNYTVDGTNYTGNEKAYGLGQKDQTLIGKQFIVVYAVDDKSNSDLNTDFIINTEQDFVDFMAEYASGPPPPDYPNKCK